MGLGRLLEHFVEAMPADLHTRATQLNDARKVLYHYGHGGGSGGLVQRATALVQSTKPNLYQQHEATEGWLPDHKQLLEWVIDRILHEGALEAFETALRFASG